MNDKDKEAFDQWFELLGETHLERVVKLNRGASSKAWQAAWEYKQKEINELKLEIMAIKFKCNKSQFENAKLRECVEFYADRKKWSPVYEGIHKYKTLYKVHRTGSKRARQVLKELEDK